MENTNQTAVDAVAYRKQLQDVEARCLREIEAVSKMEPVLINGVDMTAAVLEHANAMLNEVRQRLHALDTEMQA